MKIVSDILENIEGIGMYYIVGLLIFVILFVVIVVRTIRMPKSETEKIKNAVLNDDETEEIIPTK